MRVEAAGFQTHIRTGIELRAGESPRIDIILQVGTVNESVTVTGAAPLLQTEAATAMASLTNEVFMRIPVLQVRTWNILAYLPGVVQTGWNSFNAVGQRNRAIGHILDGVSAKQPVIGTSTSVETLQTSMDVLEEVRLLTSGIPAEYSRGGSGMLVAVMKSGTNDLHGSLEDRYLNNKLLHRRYFDVVKPSPTNVHWMSASATGPVVLPKLYNGRNKTFFVFGWLRHHEKASETSIERVPSEAMLNGDFSFGGLGFPIYDPSSTRLVSGAWVRDPFANNQIPPSRFDPVAKNFLSNNPWRKPNQAGYLEAGGPQQNLAMPTRVRYYLSRYDAKIDHQISSSHKFFARYNRDRNREFTNRGETALAWDILVAGGVPKPSDIHGVAFSDTLTIGPRTINEFRAGMVRRKYTRDLQVYGQGWAQKLGIPNTLPDTFPQFNNLGFSDYPGGYQRTVAEDFTISENLTKVAGRHTFKMGWEVIRSRYNGLDPDQPSGAYNMGGTDFPFRPQTGNGFAAFLLGSVTSATFTQSRATWLPRWWTHGLFFQDDFKPTRNLTLNLGIRWTYETPYRTKYGQQAQFDPTVKDPITGTLGAITHPKAALANRDLNNFQPRVGLAWKFRPDWVFRGSFGLMTVDLLSPATSLAFEEYFASANIQPPPGDPSIAFKLSQGPPVIPYTVNPDGTVQFAGSNYSARQATWFDPKMRMPYIMSWSGGVQWQFAPTWLLDLTYQGSSGVGLLNYWNINAIPLNISTDVAVLDRIYAATQTYRPYPQFGEIRHYSNYGHSSYHSATVRFEKRYGHGMTLNSFYTYSKAINDTDGEAGVSGITYYNRSLEKSVAGFDLRHRFVTTYTLDLPFGVRRKFMNRSGWRDRLFGGWMFTWSHTLQSGLPFTVSFANSPYRYLPGSSRPNILTPFDQAQVEGWQIGPNRLPASAQNPYLRPAAFAYPAAYTPGSLGRNTFRGPTLYWPQISMAKEWKIRERARFSLRWDMNNPFKRPQFSRPGSTYDARNLGAFGRFTGELGNFGEIGSRCHSILVFRLEW